MPPRHKIDNKVSLHVKGLRYEGWESVTVTRNIESVATTFSLGLTERYPGHLRPFRVRTGDRCQVKIGGELVLTGQVDRVAPSYSARHHTIAISGRSRTAQLVDCSASEAPGAHFGGMQRARETTRPAKGQETPQHENARLRGDQSLQSIAKADQVAAEQAGRAVEPEEFEHRRIRSRAGVM